MTLLTRIEKALEAYSTNAYCRGVDMAMHTNECLGEDIKLDRGEFGKCELEAHREQTTWMAKHKAACDITKIIRHLFSQPPTDEEVARVASAIRNVAVECRTEGIINFERKRCEQTGEWAKVCPDEAARAAIATTSC